MASIIENKTRFVGKDGSFVPTRTPKKGYVSIEYLMEMCEWVFYHDKMEYSEKLNNILQLEEYILELLGEACNVLKWTPEWSTKLKKLKL